MITVANIRTFRGDHRTAVLIDRTTMWGNPFKLQFVGDGDPERYIKVSAARAQAIRDHLIWWYSPEQTGLRWNARHNLTGDHTLLCHCKPLSCHGDTIATYLNDVVPFYATLSD